MRVPAHFSLMETPAQRLQHIKTLREHHSKQHYDGFAGLAKVGVPARFSRHKGTDTLYHITVPAVFQGTGVSTEKYQWMENLMKLYVLFKLMENVRFNHKICEHYSM